MGLKRILTLYRRFFATMHEPENRVFDVKEVSNYTGIAPITVYRLSRKGKLPAKKVGGVWRFRQKEIDQWWRERR